VSFETIRDWERFDAETANQTLASLKKFVPRKQRSCQRRYWRVAKRAERRLKRWADELTATGVSVSWVNAEMKPGFAPAVADPGRDGCLSTDAGDSQSIVDYETRCEASGQVSIVSVRRERWAEISIRTFGDRLSDEVRNQVFDSLAAASLPGAIIRASNGIVKCTRLPFGVADGICRQVRAMVSAPGAR